MPKEQLEWIVAAVENDRIRLHLQGHPDDPTPYVVARSLLPDDVQPGDRFRAVAHFNRTERSVAAAPGQDGLEFLGDMRL